MWAMALNIHSLATSEHVFSLSGKLSQKTQGNTLMDVLFLGVFLGFEMNALHISLSGEFMSASLHDAIC